MSAATEATAGRDNGTTPGGEHVTPIRVYLAVFGALLVLTYVTVQVSLLDLGATAIYVAMAVAVVKATLVATYFMHLRHETGFNRLVFVSSLLFLAIFFTLTMVDLGSRGTLHQEQATFHLRDEEAAAKRPVTPVPPEATRNEGAEAGDASAPGEQQPR